MGQLSVGHVRLVFLATLALTTLALVPSALGRAQGSADNPGNGGLPEILVLSNRADLISGGDALVQIVLPGRVDPSTVRVKLNGTDVTSTFAVRADSRYLGVVSGLAAGDNDLWASMRNGPTVHIAVTNHPIGGPVIAGPQVQPWICNNTANGVAAATDAQCDAPTTFSFRYMDAATQTFKPYDPSSPPPAAQIAQTTTDSGATVPYIVRLERGVMDRGIYDVAVLSDPSKPWAPWATQSGWNHKLLYQFGVGTAPHHSNGSPLSDLVDMALSRGFMVANNSLNRRGKSSNICYTTLRIRSLINSILQVNLALRTSISGRGLVAWRPTVCCPQRLYRD